MITAQLAQLVVIGELAMDQWRAQEAAVNAEHAYQLAIRAYEREHGHLNRRISADDPEHATAREFTAPTYKQLQQARHRVYALKTRMAKACAKLVRISAARTTEHGASK